MAACFADSVQQSAGWVDGVLARQRTEKLQYSGYNFRCILLAFDAAGNNYCRFQPFPLVFVFSICIAVYCSGMDRLRIPVKKVCWRRKLPPIPAAAPVGGNTPNTSQYSHTFPYFPILSHKKPPQRKNNLPCKKTAPQVVTGKNMGQDCGWIANMTRGGNIQAATCKVRA